MTILIIWHGHHVWNISGELLVVECVCVPLELLGVAWFMVRRHRRRLSR